MATFTFSGGTGFDMSLWTAGDIVGLVSTVFSSSHSSSQVTYADGNNTFILNGTFTAFDANNDPSAGTATSFQYTTPKTGVPTTIFGSGFSLAVPSLINAILTGNTPAVQSALFDGADTFT